MKLLAIVILQYVPTIMLTIQFMVLYFQIERLFVLSKIQSSSQMQNKITQAQMIKYIKIISWITMGFFFVIESVLILGILFNYVEKESFEIQISVITLFFIFLLNISMLVIYCKYAGMPYKSQQHTNNIKHCFFIQFYWSLALIFKEISVFINSFDIDNIFSNIEADSGGSQSKQLFYTIIFFTLSLCCDIVPYLIVIDNQFIKIFSFDLIYKFQEDEIENKDIEHAMVLQNQEDKIKEFKKQQANPLDLQEEFKIAYNSEDGCNEFPINSIDMSNSQSNPMKFMMLPMDSFVAHDKQQADHHFRAKT